MSPGPFNPFQPGPGQWDNGPKNDSMWDLLRNDPQSAFQALGMGAGNLPMPSSFPSAEEARREARERSSKVIQNWTILREILERHEATIQKRWLKKTKEQRRKILLGAWPNMPATHRPDFEAFAKESDQQRTTGTKFKDAFMWPYINQEDLLKPKILLFFLNARGRNPPDAFAMADHDAAHFGYITKGLNPAFLNEHTMMFNGRRTADTYGELISWDDDEKAFDWMMSGVGIHPGHGLHILEMQQGTLSFLVKCCQEILHDIPPDSLTGPQFPVQPEPPSVSENETGYLSLAVMASEGPYRLPASLDLSQLGRILASKISAAEDHIWALREDPGYFSDVIEAHKEHRQELLPDWNGQPHPLAKSGPNNTLWNRILSNVLGDAYFKLEIWSTLREQIVILQTLQQKYATEIVPEKELPPEYLYALLRTLHYLDQASNHPITVLQMSVMASPPLRSNFVREPQEPQSTAIRVQQRPGLEQNKSRDRLMWLFNTLWTPDLLFLASLYTVVDELERLVQTDLEAKELVSARIADELSDLAVISECIRQIKTYHPWAAGFEQKKSERDAQNEADYAKSTKGWSYLLGITDGTSLGSLGNPSEKRFFYPVDKRRTRENVEAMRHAEENLDIFWNAVDKHMKTKLRVLEHSAVYRLLSQERVLQRTPEWVEPVKAPKAQPATDIEHITKPLSELYFELEHQTECTVDRTATPAPRTKVKTRGVAQPPETTAATAAASAALEHHTLDTQPTLMVDKRTLKVLSTLFYTPSQTSQPGEVPWPDFLHAMASTGFTPEKLYGSVWQFNPTKLDMKRSIQFHEPHPSGKIPFRMARRYGRRLNRAYGWHGGMFVQA